MDRMLVKPAHQNALIPDPDHRRDLPPDGMEVNWSPYWERHLLAGNVTVEPIAPPAPEAPPAVDPAPRGRSRAGSDESQSG